MKTWKLATVAVLIIVFAACDNGTGSSGGGVPGESLAAKLEWLTSNAETNGSYVLELSTAYESIAPQTLSYTGRRNISIRLKGIGNSARVIDLSGNGPLFTIGSGVTLILDNNITLQGHISTSSLVNVDGSFVMNDGATIYGNYSLDTYSGGVFVRRWGTFTMNGGTISQGVRVAPYGTFTMNGGTIFSGGVRVDDGGTFTQNGGTIRD